MWLHGRRRSCRRRVIGSLYVTYGVILDLAVADCVPYPVVAPIGNVTLSNGQIARGAQISVGHPPQAFAFLPQWPINNTIVYGLDGYCTDPAPQTEAGCTTWRGGQYNLLGSDTRRTPTDDPDPIDGPPFHPATAYTDSLEINGNLTLHDFAFHVPLSDSLEQGYHPMMAIGLGANSTILTALQASGHIASRVWSMFFGWTGASSNTQLDGTLVFGGYDRAKVAGQSYTQRFRSDRRCPTQMLVTIEDIVLHFPNGTDASIVAATSNGSFPACIVPDFPVLVNLATDPYFSLFQEYTNTSIQHRTFGLQYYTLLYDDGEEPYTGDMSINVRDGPSIRIPNSQLVLPERYVDASDGQLVTNYSRSNLVINPLQGINGKDLSILGRQFLSSAYVMVNQDKEEFTMWSANPTSLEDLVAIDSAGRVATDFCSDSAASSPPPLPPQPLRPPETGGQADLSTGAITGIAVGAVAVILILVATLLCWRRRRRRRRSKTSAAADTTAYNNAPAVAARIRYFDKSRGSELHGDGTGPAELVGHVERPRTEQRYELVG